MAAYEISTGQKVSALNMLINSGSKKSTPKIGTNIKNTAYPLFILFKGTFFDFIIIHKL